VLKLVNGRPFWLNALLVILLGFLSLLGALKMLGVITKHGDVLSVPNVLNTNTIAAIKLLEDKGFDVVVQDSTYTDSAKLGTVLKQFPEGNSTVKVNRTVLLTVNRVVLPSVDMPNLIGKSQEYALEILARAHFTLGDTTFEPSYMQGAITQQNLRGVKVEAGAKIPWGSKIDLVIGSGLSDKQFQVPNLLGLTYVQAKALLLEKRLILASVNADADVTDSANAFVYIQYPPRENEDRSINYIREGQIMDVTLIKVMKYIAKDTTFNGSNIIDENALLEMEKESDEQNKLKEERERKEAAERRKLGIKTGTTEKKSSFPKAPKPTVKKVVKPQIPKIPTPKVPTTKPQAPKAPTPKPKPKTSV
jgi:eukaryotic-like serine/threonine-protein kinase